MIIALTGRKFSGKDTAAQVLIDKYNFTPYAFARPIKEICKTVFLWDDERINGELKETEDPVWGISPRRALQLIGTELMRQELCKQHKGFKETTGDALWAKRFIELYRQAPGNYVVTDLRFFNELMLIADTFGKEVVSIRIEREGIDKTDIHASETAIDTLPVLYTVTNNGSIADLHRRIERIYFKNSNYLVK